MNQRTTRNYQVSLWNLQDSFIAILKQYGFEYKGQIENGKLVDKDDGTQTFSFTIPMYIRKNGQRIENPSWYNVKTGNLLVNMRKIKVIFNKDAEDYKKRKIYEFLITKVKEKHQNGELYCDIECEGLAFHELGKIGYKISLTADDFYNDDYEWSTNGSWIDSYGIKHTQQPLATLQYWNDKVFSTIKNWTYSIQMNWKSYSLYEQDAIGNLTDYNYFNDTRNIVAKRASNKVYDEDFIDSWVKDPSTGQLMPTHVSAAREKARVGININESNIYNITQTLAETFGVFCKYQYEHDANCHIIGKKVIYYNNFLNQTQNTIDINYPYQTDSIERDIDSLDVVTKLFVKSTTNAASAAGITNIIDVDANKSKEDYILNFDYLYSIGAITDQQHNLVNEYILQMRDLNERINPLSAQIISLQSELVKLKSELSVLNNAIAKDTEELASSEMLLNNLTDNKQILTVNNFNPQTAVLVRDTSTSYESYYVKITQKGVYSQTIHLYKNYNYQTNKLSDQILVGQIVFDESGNVTKIVNLTVGPQDNKTVYLTYDYRPALYYDRLYSMWSAKLATDTAKQKYLTQQIGKINYNLYGIDALQSLEDIDVSEVSDINIVKRYENLIKKKEQVIKDFNMKMGPAIREGYWQPEEYTDYGNKYNDVLKVGDKYLSDNSAFIGQSGNTTFKWDNNLFENEQKLYYEYTAAQKKMVYPCINLLKNPTLLKFIQDNLNNNLNFYFKPLTSIQDNPYARNRPWIKDGPKDLYLATNLISFQAKANYIPLNDVSGIDNITGNQNFYIRNNIKTIYNNDIESNYEESLYNYIISRSGFLCQEFGEGSWKKGYTYFIWQGYNPDTQQWINLTTYDKQVNTDENPASPYIYTFSVLPEYANYIRFTNRFQDKPQQIQIYAGTTDNDINFDGWKFRLVVINNNGTNVNMNNEWINSSAGISEPTTIHILKNNTIITPTDNNILIAPENNNLVINLQFNIAQENSINYKNKYKLYKYTNSNLNARTWQANEENIPFNSYTEVNSNDYELNISDDRTIVTCNSLVITNAIADNTELRFILQATNFQNLIDNDFVTSTPCRVAAASFNKVYYKNKLIQDYVLLDEDDETKQYEFKIEYLLFCANPDIFNNTSNIATWSKKLYSSDDELITINNSSEIGQPIVSLTEENINTNQKKIKLSCKFNYIHKNTILNNWDAQEIHCLFMNTTIEQLPLKLPVLDFCMPIKIDVENDYLSVIQLENQNVSILQDKIISLYDFEEVLSSHDVTLSYQGINISECQWFITYLNRANNTQTTITLTTNESTPVVTSAQYKATLSIEEGTNIITNSLTVTIPPAIIGNTGNTNFFNDDNTTIKCIIKNDSDKYYSNINHNIRQSYYESNTATLHIVSPIGFYNERRNAVQDIYELEWWPNEPNQTYSINVPIKFYSLVTNNNNNNNILTTSSYATSPLIINPLTTLIADTTFGNSLTIENNIATLQNQTYFPQVKINQNTNFKYDNLQYYNTDYTVKITPTSELLTDYIDSDNEPIILFNTIKNNEKYGLFIKLTVQARVLDTITITKDLYIKIVIKQCPPEFNKYYNSKGQLVRNPWQPDSAWMATALNENSTTILIGPGALDVRYLPREHPLLQTLSRWNYFNEGSTNYLLTRVIEHYSAHNDYRKLFHYRQVTNTFWANVKQSFAWNIPISTFDFNDASVTNYKWGLRTYYLRPQGRKQTDIEPAVKGFYNTVYNSSTIGGTTTEALCDIYETAVLQNQAKKNSFYVEGLNTFWKSFFASNLTKDSTLKVTVMTSYYMNPGIIPGFRFESYDPIVTHINNGLNQNLYVIASNKWGTSISKTLGVWQLSGYGSRMSPSNQGRLFPHGFTYNDLRTDQFSYEDKGQADLSGESGPIPPYQQEE